MELQFRLHAWESVVLLGLGEGIHWAEWFRNASCELFMIMMPDAGCNHDPKREEACSGHAENAFQNDIGVKTHVKPRLICYEELVGGRGNG